VTSASTEFVLPKGQIPDGQSFNVCIKSTNNRFSFYDQYKTGFNSFGKKAEAVTFSIEQVCFSESESRSTIKTYAIVPDF
jgi:hypothetical protein